PGGLEQRALGVRVELTLVVDDPDRADRLAARADRDRRTRLQVVIVDRATTEDLAKLGGGHRHHAVGCEDHAVERADPGRVGYLTADDRPPARRHDRPLTRRRAV